MKEFLPKSAAKMADCLMKRYGLLTSRWSYDYGVAWRGMEALYAMTGEKKYFDYIKDAMDTFVTDESGAIRDYTLDEFNLDYICNGRQLLYLYKATGEKKYLRAADVLRDQLRRQPRTSDGGILAQKVLPLPNVAGWAAHVRAVLCGILPDGGGRCGHPRCGYPRRGEAAAIGV